MDDGRSGYLAGVRFARVPARGGAAAPPMSTPHPPSSALFACLLLSACLLHRVARGEESPGTDRGGPLQFASAVHDFGVAEQNKEYVAQVAYRNTAAVPLAKIHVETDCGCYAAAPSHAELAPGQEGTLRVRFRTLSFSGPVSKTLRLAYLAGGKEHAAPLRLKLNVVGGVVVHPGRLHFGEVLAGTKPADAVAVVWYEGVGRPFEIRSVEVGDQPLTTRVEPFRDPQRPHWKGWRVHFAFREPPPRGVYSQRAMVTTTHPDTPRVTIPLTAHVVGKVWVQKHRIHLGLVQRGKPKSGWITFRPFSPDIRLGKVTARARRGILETKVEPCFGPSGPGQRLRVTVPADAPVGPLDDVIELRTEVPGEEVTEIQVRGRVFEKRGP